MRTIENLLQAALKVDIGEAIEETLYDTSQQYTDLQREQMYAGVQSDGSDIRRVGKPADYIYAEQTIKAKNKKGQLVDRVTLKDTSSFQTEIFADPRSDGFFVDSADQKSQQLQIDYGTKILGLADDRRQTFVSVAQPIYQGHIENKLNNGASV